MLINPSLSTTLSATQSGKSGWETPVLTPLPPAKGEAEAGVLISTHRAQPPQAALHAKGGGCMLSPTKVGASCELETCTHTRQVCLMHVQSIKIIAAAKLKVFKHISGGDECFVHAAARFGTGIQGKARVCDKRKSQCNAESGRRGWETPVLTPLPPAKGGGRSRRAYQPIALDHHGQHCTQREAESWWEMKGLSTTKAQWCITSRRAYMSDIHKRDT